MERKIGEIFEHKGEWYQCVRNIKNVCKDCAFFNNTMKDNGKIVGAECYNIPVGSCGGYYRKDRTSICFKKLEKVGEPFTCNYYGDNRLIMMQEYKAYDNRIVTTNGIRMYVTDEKHKIVAIEIKQNQEDMEEKKLTYEELEHYYNTTVGLWAIDRSPQEVDLEWITKNAFQLGIDEKLSNLETTGKNLRPFSIEAAKAGKPVCTRNGRKARIVLFDLKDRNYPIAAAVQDNDGDESIRTYTTEGIYDKGEISGLDLMMLPEKHEGWINVYKDDRPYTESDNIYSSKEAAVEASKAINKKDYVTTVKIEWEE